MVKPISPLPRPFSDDRIEALITELVQEIGKSEVPPAIAALADALQQRLDKMDHKNDPQGH